MRQVLRPAAPGLLATMSLVALLPSVLAVASWGWMLAAPLVSQLMLTLAGVLMWLGREPLRHAVALVLAGVAIGASNLDSLQAPLGGYWGQAAFLLHWVSVPLLVPVLLAYPHPRLRSRSERWVVGATWGWALLPHFVSSMTWNPVDAGVAEPEPWFSLAWAPQVSDWALSSGAVLLVGLAVWFSALEVRRWQTAPGPSRGTVRLVAGAGILLAFGLVLREAQPWGVLLIGLDPSSASWLALLHNSVLAAAPIALVIVAVRSASRRAVVVARLLTAAGDAAAVQTVLREELQDPTLRIRFDLDGGWVDADGAVSGPGAARADTMHTDTDAAGPDTGRAGSEGAADPDVPGRVTRVLLRDGGRPTAVMDADQAVELDPARLHVTLAAASIVLENTRLALERTAHLAELGESRARIVQAGVTQRRGLERDLHDGAQQSLLAVATTLSRATLAPDGADLRPLLDDARAQLSAALAELRNLAHGIHPAALSQGGLAAGLAALVPGRHLDLRLGPGLADGERLPPPVESTAYFVVAEAVTNAVKHAAGSEIVVELRLDPGRDDRPGALLIRVRDHGLGGAVAVPIGGLAGLGDRVRALGGTLTIDSPPGQGTRVDARLPLDPAAQSSRP
ncbi:MAG: ATP-binding protein [Dermatophilaceae bacterium]